MKLIKTILVIIFVVIAIDFLTVILLFFRFQRVSDDLNHKLKGKVVGVIFFRDFNKEKTDIGIDSARRANKIISLYKRGLIDDVICVGGSRKNIGVYGSDYVKEFLVKENVPDERVYVDNISYDTKTNWREALMLLEKINSQSAVIVASPLHVIRIKKMIKRLNDSGNLEIVYDPYSLVDLRPKIKFLDFFSEFHYELSAFAYESLLPGKVKSFLIKKIRSQE